MKNFTSLGAFLQAFVSNRSKDLFTARLGSTLLLARFGITGWVADTVGWFIRGVIGVLIDEGIYQIDVTLDSIKAAMSIPDFKKTAEAEYKKAQRKDLTDAEKNQILQEYLDTLDKFTKLHS